LRKLALSDEILLTIEKPARYIGNEVNMVVKDPKAVEVRFAMCFPDVYEIGMSHLGIQIIYDMLNRREDVYCERVYSPWTDLDAIMRKEHIPLFAVESQDPIKDFDFLGITIQYEMCYTNILQILDLSQIPLRAVDRTEDDPIVIGGGPCTYNPEPIAEFFDIINIGEAEVVYDDFIELYKQVKANGGSRMDFLRQVAKTPGMYVPQFYDVTYKEDGTIASFFPIVDDVPATIKRQIEMKMSDTYYPTKPLVPFIQATQDRVVLEIQRGCIRGCRFCQAGQVYKPVRERSLEFLTEHAVEMLDSTGYEEISLSSLSSSDYSHLPELIDFLIDHCGKKRVNISLPSLRIDAFSLDVMQKVQDVKKSSLTFAPEAGTQRLRNVINKGLTEEVILKGAGLAFHGGWNRVKLYFMLGLPTETPEDEAGIAQLAEKVAMLYYDEIPKEERHGKVQVTASASFFIPKPFTALQWAPMYPCEEYDRRAHYVNDQVKAQLNKKSIKFQWHNADVSVLEGILARGDRRVSKAILRAYEKGCIYDAWSESFRYDKWQEALAETGITEEFYNLRQRDLDEIFPWDFIDTGVTKDYLKREWKRAMQEQVTPNCRMACANCGAQSFGGGVCFESKN
jgi:radical SAM family uncharacterized protein